MSKVYTLTSTSCNPGYRHDWGDSTWESFSPPKSDWADERKARRVGYYYDYRNVNILFDENTLTTLRGKTIISPITLTITVVRGRLVTSGSVTYPIGYKYNNQASPSGASDAWARSDASSTAPSGSTTVGYVTSNSSSTFEADNTQMTYSLGTTVPWYGYVIGTNQSNTSSNITLGATATLTVTTNETDYTLSYNANNGSGAPASETKTGTTSYTFTISSTVPTRAGYDFLGWATSSSASTASYQPGGTITVSSNTTLYAVWKIKTYTVSYNVNGGSGTFANQTKNYGGSFTIHSTKPTKASASAGSYTVTYNGNSGTPGVASQSAARTTSYTFSVWNTAQNGSGTSYAAGATYSANASATLYAQYTSSTTTASVSLTSASRTGYTFNGWYTAASGGTRVGGAGSAYTPTGNVTLYAQWTASSATLSSVTSTVYCGNSLTGSWTSTGSTYKYKLKVTCGSATAAWSSLTAANASSATVQIPTDWYTMVDGPLKNTDSATATCELYTYASDGTTQIGTATSKTFAVKVPSTVAPTLGSLAYSSSSTNSVVSGWGSSVFVQGYSKVTLTLSVTSYNGSALKSVRFVGPGLDSTGTSMTSPASSVVTLSSGVSYTAYCTDTRDHTSSIDVDVPFYAYAPPAISGITVGRTNQDKTPNNGGGTYISMKPSYGISDVGGRNSSTATLSYSLHGSSTPLWSQSPVSSGTTYYSADSGQTISLTSAYDVTVTVSDLIQQAEHKSSALTVTLPTVQGLWYGKGNDRLGLGGVPEGPGLWCDWDATFKGVVDVVPRRCYAPLSSEGWYRVMQFTGWGATAPYFALSGAIDFTIMRAFNYTNNEVHKISLLASYYNIAFANEVSKSNAVLISKIRYVVDGNNGYVDIRYESSSANTCYVDFVVHFPHERQSAFSAVTPTKVADTPSGTVVTEYTFAANGDNNFKTIGVSKTTTSGYFTVTDASITANSRVIATPQYYSGATIPWFIMLQPSSGTMNVYVRDVNGNVPADNTKIDLDILIDNR